MFPLFAEAGLSGNPGDLLVMLLVALVAIVVAVVAVGGLITAALVFLVWPNRRATNEVVEFVDGEEVVVRVPNPAAKRMRVAKIVVAGLLVAPVVLALGWFVSIQPSRDFLRLRAAGLQATDASNDSDPWLQSQVVAVVERKPWYILWEHGLVTEPLSPAELAKIVRRHPELRTFQLKSQGSHVEVLREAAKTRVEIIHVETDQPIAADWVNNLRTRAQLKELEFNAPGLTPASVLQIVQRCPDLKQLRIPLSAVDDAACTAIIGQGSIQSMRLFRLAGEPVAPAEEARVARLIGRLQQHFPPTHFVVVGPGWRR